MTFLLGVLLGKVTYSVTKFDLWVTVLRVNVLFQRSVLLMPSFGYELVNYIDDLAGAESECSAMEAFNCLGDLLFRLGLRESIEKVTSPSTVMTVLGISFDHSM